MPPEVLLKLSVVFTLYCSNEAGRESFGACIWGRLPLPEILIPKVNAELAATSGGGATVSNWKSPTAPEKPEGAPAGSSFTVMDTGAVATLRRTSCMLGPPKKSSMID